MTMKQKSKRLFSSILAGLLFVSTVFGGAITTFANGNGTGGSSIRITGAGAGNWGRNACGGGYLVSIVKYDKSLDDSEDAISASALDNAYKDSILVYNTKGTLDYVDGHTVTVSLGIRAGLASQGGGDLLDNNGNVVGEDGIDAYTVTAIKGSSEEAKNLLGFETTFGSGSNYAYDTTPFYNLYGQDGTFDFNNETDRSNWYSAVEAIYGSGCTLGGVTREAWVSNDAGDNCAYCILIVPVALFANSTSPSDVSVVACYPASGVVNKTSIINACQIQWGSFGEVGATLDTIVGYNMTEEYDFFKGYVPYGMWGNPSTKVGANIAAYLDTTSFNTGLSDVKYTIVAADEPDEISKPTSATNNTTLTGVNYLYGDAGTDRVIDPAVDKTAKSVTGVSNVDDYKLTEASVFTVDTKNTVLYGSNNNALNKILSGVSSRFSTTYVPSLVSGVVSAGNYYRLNITIDGATSYKSLTSALQKYMVSFSNYGNAKKVGNIALSGSASQEDISANYLTNALYNSGSFASIKSTDSKDTAKSGKKTQLGVSVQLYTKAKTVKSYLKAYDVKVDSTGNFVSTTEAGTYTSDKYSYMDYVDMEYKSSIGSIADSENKMLKKVYYFLVPNNTAYGHSNNFSPAIQSASYEDWSVVLSGDESISTKRFSEVTPSVGVTSENEGYTVYVVRVYEDGEYGDVNVKSTLELQDYELSHVYQSIYSDIDVRTSNFSSKKAGSTLSHTWFSGYSKAGVAQYDNCTYTTYVDDFNRYIWQTLSKVSGTNSIVSKNGNVGAWQTVIKKYNKEMLQPTNISTLILSNEKKVDENVLLTRDIGDGDSLVASSISLQSAQEVDDFITDVLKMNSGNKPASAVKGDTVRDSNYVLSTAKDLFKFQGGWVSSYNDDYSGAYGVEDEACPNSNLHVHINAKLVERAYKTLYAGSVLSNVAKVQLTEITHKYVTDAMATGTNTDKLLDDYNVVASDSKNIDGVLTQSYALPIVKNNYRYVQDPLTNVWSESTNPIINNFYGEVQMVAQIPNIGDSLTSITQYNVWVMSEKLRSVQASSLYFITANSGDERAIDQDKTKLYSDNSVSNANGIGATNPVLYAGADVDLVVDTNIKVSTYGYSLDIINTADVPEGYSSYSEIIADGSDVATTWGNSSNKADLLKAFTNFSSDVFKSINADITLEDTVNGSTNVYSNFSTSMGNYTEAGVAENGVYQIVIKDGILDSSNPSYQLMLKQLAKDYFGDVSKTAEAAELFKASGIYQSIQDAIESDVSSVNTSQAYEYLGNGSHWYDEQVKTFVIRRYTNYAVINNVTLSDKLDYNMGGANISGSNDNIQNSYNNSECKWYLSLYFDKNLSSDYMKNIITSWYNPADDNHSAAINASSVLVNHLYIPSVDFNIASDAVAD